MSKDSFHLALDALLASGCHGRRGRRARGPALSYAKREAICSEWDRQRKFHTRTWLLENSSEIFNYGHRVVEEVLVFHPIEMYEEWMENSNEMYKENELIEACELSLKKSV